MKKTLTLILALALLLSLAACGGTAAPAQESEVSEEIFSGMSEAVIEAPAAEAFPAEEPAEEAQAETPAADFEPDFRFATTTLDGTAVDESILQGHTLTMINFFEPWCPPCVAELPELEKLYEAYASRGFQILGVFSTEDGVQRVLDDASVSYPVLRYVSAFDEFQTGYVPTTIFVDGQGRVVGKTQIGSNSYEGWEMIVKELLG